MADLLTIPSTVNVDMVCGDSKTIRVRVFTITDGRRVPVDLSDVTSIIWVLARNNKSTPLVTKTLEGNGCATIEIDGFWHIDVNLHEEDTKPTDPDTKALVGSYYHECQVKRPGLTDTPFNGTLTIVQDLI